MTRHPKKKEDKNSDPNVKDLPPEQPTSPQMEDVIKTGLNKLFWIRVGMGILSGVISAMAGNSVDDATRPFMGFGLAIALFIVSVVIGKAMHIPLPVSDKKKLVMTGIGTYFGMFIFWWILVNTLMHPAATGLGIVK